MKKILSIISSSIITYLLVCFLMMNWFVDYIQTTDNNSLFIIVPVIWIYGLVWLFFVQIGLVQKTKKVPTWNKWVNYIVFLGYTVFTVVFTVDFKNQEFEFYPTNIEIESITETSTKYIVEVSDTNYHTLYVEKLDSINYDTVCYDDYILYRGAKVDILGDSLRSSLKLGNGKEFLTLKSIRN